MPDDDPVDDDVCDECGKTLNDEDYILESQTHNFWGASCVEPIIIGYKCHHCGYVEMF